MNTMYRLVGSACPATTRCVKTSAVLPTELISFSIHIRRNPQSKLLPGIEEHSGGNVKHFTHETFQLNYGMLENDLAAVTSFCIQYHLKVEKVIRPLRIITVTAQAKDIEQAFGISLHYYTKPDNQVSFYANDGDIFLPLSLEQIVTSITGLDNYPALHPHVRISNMDMTGSNGYFPAQVAKLYSFPTNVNGNGQSIGIVELSGGYQPTELSAYFTGQKGLSFPPLKDVFVDDATNSPGVSLDSDQEVCLDIEVAGSVANGAKLSIYFCQATYQSFINGVATAIHDSVANNSVISISWGAVEMDWSTSLIQEMNTRLQEAAALGITVCASSGDLGANCGWASVANGDNNAYVEFPASSPWVLACGGTTMNVLNNAIANENVWNKIMEKGGATGGGISTVNPIPNYQTANSIQTISANLFSFVSGTIPTITGNVSTSSDNGPIQTTVYSGKPQMRGVPDVSGNADPSTGYIISCNGNTTILGGTSAVAPLWAGLIALMNESLNRRLGFLNHLLYSEPNVRDTLNDIVFDASTFWGNNNINGAGFIGYSVGKGWDACTGLGTPNGEKLLKALSDHFSAK